MTKKTETTTKKESIMKGFNLESEITSFLRSEGIAAETKKGKENVWYSGLVISRRNVSVAFRLHNEKTELVTLLKTKDGVNVSQPIKNDGTAAKRVLAFVKKQMVL